MLFDEDSGKGLSKELLEQLKQRALDVAKVIQGLREENERMAEKLASNKGEVDALKERIAYYESEREELKSIVEELLTEFDKVSR